MEDDYLITWKSIANYLGKHPQTLRFWHYNILKLPFVKSHPSQQGRPIVHKMVADAWVIEKDRIISRGK